jgi:hypothetical protein
MKWWEKTVEYYFVMQATKERKMVVAPLDGDEERAGDAICCLNNKWILIEFKKNKQRIVDEKRKFSGTNFSDAKAALMDKDSHHYIVYGNYQQSPYCRFGLCFQTYFSEKNVKTINEMLRNGSDIDNFIHYINEYIHYKKPSPGPGSDPSGLSVDFMLVAGINNNDCITVCMSLSDFLQINGAENNEGNDSYFTA